MNRSNPKNNFPKTVKIKLSGLFEDKRGEIINISNELVKSCALIKSKKNSYYDKYY